MKINRIDLDFIQILWNIIGQLVIELIKLRIEEAYHAFKRKIKYNENRKTENL